MGERLIYTSVHLGLRKPHTSYPNAILCTYIPLTHSKAGLKQGLPPTNGWADRTLNQVIEHYSRAYTNYQQDDWASWLPLAQLAYNSSEHSTLQTSPSEALMGFRTELRINIEGEPIRQFAHTAGQRAQESAHTRETLRELLQQAKERQKYYYDRHRQSKTFKAGDWVAVNAKKSAPYGRAQNLSISASDLSI